MSPKAMVKTKCPSCEKKYNVPASSVGHRARCSACHTVFRVTQRAHHPTEDDIMRWLNEAAEETDRHDPHHDNDSKFDNEPPALPPQEDFQAPEISMIKTQIRLRKTG